jgi:type VI secretion system protein ImpC|tara:strand:+ start:798 stop:2285 length:1488 start_codon:yes stop_codon:yes gene_type:complete
MATENVKQTEQIEGVAPGGVLEKIIQDGNMIAEPSQGMYAKQMLGQLATQILDEGMITAPDAGVVAAINDRVAEIDRQLTDQLNAIMHDQAFQDLESRWRGLSDFVFGTETSTRLKIRVLNVSQAELLKDLESAVDYDQSVLFKKVYEDEYGTLGGFPYSALIGDFYFGRHPQDVALCRRISEVACAAHAPFVASSSPKLFDMKSWTELAVPRDLSKIFESAEVIPWRSFRESEDSRYCTLVLPRYASRLPYGEATNPVEQFAFEEAVDGRDHDAYLWSNMAYQLGLKMTDAFAKYGWTTAIRGVEGGGKISDLPAHTFTTDEGDIALKCPTETLITDRREKELNDLGFCAAVSAKGTNFAAFFSGQTVNKPVLYNTDSANANAKLSARLPYIMAASRFAHYLKVMMRDKIGSFESQETIANYLNNWIADYVLLDDAASQDTKARFPLREARVDVLEVAGSPGAYTATVFLRPHFQLEEITASIRLVAELPAPAA